MRVELSEWFFFQDGDFRPLFRYDEVTMKEKGLLNYSTT